jgi:predicted dehydrogenase
MDNVEIVGVSDIDKEKLNTCTEQFGINNAIVDYNEILSSDVEAVNICTSNETHFQVCKDALIAGKHVLVEKPLTVNTNEAYELVDLANESKKYLAVGHLFRFNNAINEVKNLIEKKILGDLYYLRLQWTIQWMPEIYPDKKLDIIVDMMPHLYDIMNYLTGLWPKNITCFGKAFIKKDLEDTAYIICEFPNNIMTHSEISWTLPEKVRNVDVIGSSACAKIQTLSQEVKLFENDNVGKNLDIKSNNTLRDELNHFICTIENSGILINNGAIGAKTTELIEKTIESLKSDKKINL